MKVATKLEFGNILSVEVDPEGSGAEGLEMVRALHELFERLEMEFKLGNITADDIRKLGWEKFGLDKNSSEPNKSHDQASRPIILGWDV